MIAVTYTKFGTVSAEASSWPGLHCLHQVIDEKPRLYPFVHYSREDEKGRPQISYHSLNLTPLPQMSSLDKAERAKTLKVLINTSQEELVSSRKEKGQGFLGAKAIRSQPVGRKPIEVSYSPRPVCYTKDPEIRREYKADRRLFEDAYFDASERFRKGDLYTEFPLHCFKPPLHRLPRIRTR